ncbi:TRAP transporter TatT component family protein [Candidatus Poribacteria bacterium]
MTNFTANRTTMILVKAAVAYDRESDLELAEQAIPSNLKMLEGLLEVTPNNKDLLWLTSSSFTRYAFGFVEERIEIADEQYDLVERDRLIRRAVDFYERGKTYGLRLMAQSRKKFPEVMEQDLEHFSAELKHLKKKHVPALFWTAYAWGSIINLQQGEPARLAELPRVEIMMQRVLELDESYFLGGVHMFYGAYYVNRGDPSKAKQHLERAIEISDGKYLMAKFLLARHYSVSVQDKELFQRTLQEILSAPSDLFPEQRLANELAKRRAKRWLKRADELFF